MEFERLQAIIADKLNISADRIKLESRFEEDLSADSLDLLNVVMEVEEEFGISISDEELMDIKTVEDALEAINKVINE